MAIKFDFKNSLVSKKDYVKIEEKLVLEIASLNKALINGYNDDRASINLPIDKENIEESKKAAKKISKAQTLIVIGIGGSNLGTIAVYEALKGRLYNETQSKKVYFADTTDPIMLNDIIKIINKEIKAKRKVALNVISKSGGTTETIVNFEILKDSLKEQENYEDYIVLTTGKDSKLWNYGEEKGYSLLDVPKKVGGRYSVLSNVGLFPLTFLEVDIKDLLRGASDARKQIISINNPIISSAINIYYHYTDKKNILNTFLFSSQMESVGKWYRQLIGESIGKEYDNNGKKVNVGITPITSIGSTDLHSMAQLFIGGPNDKFHTFIHVENNKNFDIPNSKILPIINKKTVNSILTAILKGTQGAFKKKQIPYQEIILEKLDEYNIGYLLQMKMIEAMLIGALLNINPFDQPNVEEYKVITKKLLQ